MTEPVQSSQVGNIIVKRLTHYFFMQWRQTILPLEILRRMLSLSGSSLVQVILLFKSPYS